MCAHAYYVCKHPGITHMCANGACLHMQACTCVLVQAQEQHTLPPEPLPLIEQQRHARQVDAAKSQLCRHLSLPAQRPSCQGQPPAAAPHLVAYSQKKGSLRHCHVAPNSCPKSIAWEWGHGAQGWHCGGGGWAGLGSRSPRGMEAAPWGTGGGSSAQRRPDELRAGCLPTLNQRRSIQPQSPACRGRPGRGTGGYSPWWGSASGAWGGARQGSGQQIPLPRLCQPGTSTALCPPGPTPMPGKMRQREASEQPNHGRAGQGWCALTCKCAHVYTFKCTKALTALWLGLVTRIPSVDRAPQTGPSAVSASRAASPLARTTSHAVVSSPSLPGRALQHTHTRAEHAYRPAC